MDKKILKCLIAIGVAALFFGETIHQTRHIHKRQIKKYSNAGNRNMKTKL